MAMPSLTRGWPAPPHAAFSASTKAMTSKPHFPRPSRAAATELGGLEPKLLLLSSPFPPFVAISTSVVGLCARSGPDPERRLKAPGGGVNSRRTSRLGLSLLRGLSVLPPAPSSPRPPRSAGSAATFLPRSLFALRIFGTAGETPRGELRGLLPAFSSRSARGELSLRSESPREVSRYSSMSHCRVVPSTRSSRPGAPAAPPELSIGICKSAELVSTMSATASSSPRCSSVSCAASARPRSISATCPPSVPMPMVDGLRMEALPRRRTGKLPVPAPGGSSLPMSSGGGRAGGGGMPSSSLPPRRPVRR
mmetsp:Transcript_2/g.11  ORF Transcript_2/g.11 Transcript_2/m.11 type:complete len:308 (+) Transcript_2:320-1243(+)